MTKLQQPKPQPCACGHSRGAHITAIHGQPLGKCYKRGCACKEFKAAGARKTAQAEARQALAKR